MRKITEIRVDFSLKREVFFVVIGAILGAVTFVIPKAIFEVEMGLPYYLTWIAFGHILGVYSSQSSYCRNSNSYANCHFHRSSSGNIPL
jgi:NADH:quinone reductase (non-electrogenic)